MSGMPIYVAFYTPRYVEEVKNLQASLDKFGLRHLIFKAEDLGSWDLNTKQKAVLIRHVLLTHNCNVVYVDADAVIQQYPELLDVLDCDFAAHFKDQKELLSGTLFFSPKAVPLVDAWIEENAANPKVWDQKNLATVLDTVPGLKHSVLPPTYCQIFDTMKHSGEPVIEHFQASRRLKKR